MSVFDYFGVKDIRHIRHSDRFNNEIRPLFHGNFLLAVDDDGKVLIVIGQWLVGPSGPGVYHFGTEGEFTGRCFRSQMTC